MTMQLRGLLLLAAGLGATTLSSGCCSEVRREQIENQKYLDRVDARLLQLERVCDSCPRCRELRCSISKGPGANVSAGENYK